MNATGSPQLAPPADEREDALVHALLDAPSLRGRRRGSVVRRVLLAADVVGLTLAFLAAAELFPPHDVPDSIGPSHELLLFFGTLPVWAFLFNAGGLYGGDEDRASHSTADDLIGVFHVVTTGTFMVIMAGWLTGWFDPSPPKLLAFWLLAIALVTVTRATSRALVHRIPSYLQRTLIVGAGEVGQRVAEKILRHPEYGIDLLGFLDARPRTLKPVLGEVPVLAPAHDLADVVRRHRVDRVVLAFTDEADVMALDTVRSLGDEDVRVDIVPRFFETLGVKPTSHALEGVPLLALPRFRLSRSAALAKRCFDLVVAALALVILAPLLVAIAVAIALDSEGPILFRQVRTGEGGTPFRILKFRTMTIDAERRKPELSMLNKHVRPGGDPRMFKVSADPRVTRVGALLRRYSLDELPQLLNVLRGEMSLVGPRPLIPEEDTHVVDWRRRRLRVKPGITGLWQVLGRDDIPFEEMAILDCSYVTEWSLIGDVQLILRTLPAMVRPRSAY